MDRLGPLAVAAHLSLTRLTALEAEQRVAKPLTTQFVKRAPRLTKPLELKKRPRPRKRALERTMVSVRARVDLRTVASTIQAGRIARSLARPSIRLARAMVTGVPRMEPLSLADAVQGGKEDRRGVDMALEMVDVEALDTGKYRAMVIQDPSDKRSMRGFLHLGVVYCQSSLAADVQADLIGYIHKVVYAMNKYTDIKTDLKGYYTFDSSEILEIPWIFTNIAKTITLNRSETLNTGRYLTIGGLLFLETNCAHSWERPGGKVPLRSELLSGQDTLKEALAAAGYRCGKDWTFERLVGDHPMYHCYFDFDGPLPSYWSDRVLVGEFIYGITIEGRLLVVFETGDYERFINDNLGGLAMDGSRYRQFLVNVVVYALTQEGSLTRRLMDAVRY